MALQIKFNDDYSNAIDGEIRRTFYSNYPEATALIVYSKSEYGDFMEVYSKLTVNLNDTVQTDGKTVFIDSAEKIGNGLVKAIERFGSYTGYEKRSGFVTYRAFRFDDSALEKMDRADQ